jgi:hypothetical protein
MNLGQFLLSSVTGLQSFFQLLIVFGADIVIAKIVVEGSRDLAGVLDSIRAVSVVRWIP